MKRQTPESKRTKFTGRARLATFLRLPHYIIDSPEFGSLSGKAVKLLVEIGSKYRGNNNGNLSIPWDGLKSRGWQSRTTLVAARDELVERGWIEISRHGGNHVCNLYAITWEAVDECAGNRLEISPTTTPKHLWRKKLDVQNLDGFAVNRPETGRIAA